MTTGKTRERQIAEISTAILSRQVISSDKHAHFISGGVTIFPKGNRNMLLEASLSREWSYVRKLTSSTEIKIQSFYLNGCWF